MDAEAGAAAGLPPSRSSRSVFGSAGLGERQALREKQISLSLIPQQVRFH
jgi:hypothetical protein